MKENINTKEYWDRRFGSGDWEEKEGRGQTKEFALSQMPLLDIDPSFEGSILDFGCGLGDAIPIYRKKFPNAELIGIDISEEAIKKCRGKYGRFARFICGSHLDVPLCDVIIASNVFEHLSNDIEVARHLKERCRSLNIIVPYNEQLNLERSCTEHVNSYDKEYFSELGKCNFKIFNSKGWSEFGFNLFINIYVKNFFRPMLGKSRLKRKKQILFTFCE